MTAPNQENTQVQQEQKPNDKEYNFRQLEAKFQKQLAEEKGKREEAEKLLAQESAKQRQQIPDDEDDGEPYVDHKKLKKSLSKLGENTQSEIQKAMEMAKYKAKEELKQEMWLEQNPDFYDVLQHAERFAQKAPKLAETILRMPEGFERQKLVYENIKTLGIDKPEQKQSSIQDKIDANRKSPYYQPSGVGSAPYNAGQGDYSDSGQKSAYAKMQELKKRLRI
jgi:hypothetical protein